MSECKVEKTGFGNIVVLQRPGLGYGVDSVLLAAFAAGETGAKAICKGSNIADFGTGSGIVAFILAHKVPETRILGLDVRQDAIYRAQKACKMNSMEDRLDFVLADISDEATMEGYKGKFDAVVTNPPYFRRSGALRSESDERYIARHETTAELGDFLRNANKLLKNRGSLYMVHRPDRLADIICEMRACNIEPKTLQMVVPRAGESANIVLIHGIKGAGRELRVLPEIAVHGETKDYTDEIMHLYER